MFRQMKLCIFDATQKRMTGLLYHASPWSLTVTQNHSWSLMVTHGHSWYKVMTNVHTLSGLDLDLSTRLQPMSLHFQSLMVQSYNQCLCTTRVQSGSQDYHMLSRDIKCYQVLSGVINSYQVLSLDYKWYQVLSSIIRWYQVLSSVNNWKLDNTWYYVITYDNTW